MRFHLDGVLVAPEGEDPRGDSRDGEGQRRVMGLRSVHGDQGLVETAGDGEAAAHAGVVHKEEGHGDIGPGQQGPTGLFRGSRTLGPMHPAPSRSLGLLQKRTCGSHP